MAQKTVIAKYYRLYTIPFVFVTIRYIDNSMQVDNKLIPWLHGITQVFTRLPTSQ